MTEDYSRNHVLGTIAFVKIARLFSPDLNLKGAKDEFEAFSDTWKEAVGERIWKNEHYHTYFVLLYILTFLGEPGLLLDLVLRVPAEVKAPFYAIVAGMMAIKNNESKEIIETLINSIGEMHMKSTDVLENLLAEIDSLEEAEEAADEAEAETKREAEERLAVARHVSNPNAH